MVNQGCEVVKKADIHNMAYFTKIIYSSVSQPVGSKTVLSGSRRV